MPSPLPTESLYGSSLETGLRYAPRPMSTFRTRFAPSPTGFLHIGGARTALFNWALTRQLGGEFVLRVEDTDLERSTRESEKAVLDGLGWLGIDWDEGPHRQSERAARHAEVVESLLVSKAAYRCVCTKEDLDARREADVAAGGKGIYDGRCRELDLGPECGPHTVRLRVDRSASLRWDDLVFGPSGQEASEIGDGVIRRTDGTPLYHLAVVVDDLDMNITHVIRGADHHSNTPFQLALYRALDSEPPIFAHVPLIVAESGRKLSKRKDPVSLQQFKSDGYLPEAMLNWLARLGWSHGDQEIFSTQEIVKYFDLEHVGRSGAQADLAKLDWLNQHYLKEYPAEILFETAKPFLDAVAGRPVERSAGVDKLLDLLRERSHHLKEMAEKARFALVDEIEIEAGAAKKHLRPVALEPLEALIKQIESGSDWTLESIAKDLEATCAALDGLKLGKLAQPVRVAVTGSGASPGIYETLEVVGRERTLDRLGRATDLIRARVADTN
jgi:glutamyl-tRNA synthetase